jgi:hypothetical protein
MMRMTEDSLTALNYQDTISTSLSLQDTIQAAAEELFAINLARLLLNTSQVTQDIKQ